MGLLQTVREKRETTSAEKYRQLRELLWREASPRSGDAEKFGKLVEELGLSNEKLELFAQAVAYVRERLEGGCDVPAADAGYEAAVAACKAARSEFEKVLEPWKKRLNALAMAEEAAQRKVVCLFERSLSIREKQSEFPLLFGWTREGAGDPLPGLVLRSTTEPPSESKP